MHRTLLQEIGAKIKKVRREKGLTVQAVADRVGVSKGLISRIENGHNLPSLPVLIGIIKGLDTSLNSFFRDIEKIENQSVNIIRAEDLKPLKLNESGSVIFPMKKKKLDNLIISTNILEISPGTLLKKTKQDSLKYKFILEGQLQYKIGEKVYALNKGDSFYFDGNEPHFPANHSNKAVRILEIEYLKKNS
jgi:transcriptional regulator with XRE-family HTH domain